MFVQEEEEEEDNDEDERSSVNKWDFEVVSRFMILHELLFIVAGRQWGLSRYSAAHTYTYTELAICMADEWMADLRLCYFVALLMMV